ncbi:sulfotransferase [Nocardioides pacificus]
MERRTRGAAQAAARRLPGVGAVIRERDQLRDELDRTRQELRRQRRRAQGKAPDDLGYLFIMTYGRSGSTLLQGVLNTLPGYVVRGENRDALRHLYLFHRGLQAQKRRFRKQETGEPSHPFFGIEGFRAKPSLNALRRVALDTVLRPEPDTRVVGFKEIRWYGEDLADYVAFLRELFPGARFVLNTRDHDDVASSKWWADKPDVPARLAEIEARMLAVAADLGDDAFHVRFDEWVGNPEALRPMLDWLGEEYDEATIRATFEVRHSY